MKIAFISFMEGKEGGGSARVAEWLAKSFSASGDDVVFITTQPKRGLQVRHNGNMSTYAFRPRNLYWVGHKDSQPIYKKVPWQLLDIWNWHTFAEVRQILQREGPDVVHIHKLRGLSPSLFSAARSVNCKRIIHTLHDHELISPEGTLHGRIGRVVKKNALPIKAYQAIRRPFTQCVHQVTAPSDYLLRTVMAYGFFRNAHQCIIPNSHGLSQSELKACQRRVFIKRERPEGELRLLYLGRLEAMKGIEFFYQAFLDAWQLNPRLRLDIVGFGSMSDGVKQYATHPAITMHGAQWGAEKSRIISHCDMMVVPSISPENAPLTILEAYIHGKPLLASNIGGIPELIVEGKTGFLLPPNDLSSWVTMLVSLAEQPESLKQMLQPCFNEAKKYTTETVINAYKRLYATFPVIPAGE